MPSSCPFDLPIMYEIIGPTVAIMLTIISAIISPTGFRVFLKLVVFVYDWCIFLLDNLMPEYSIVLGFVDFADFIVAF